MPYRPRRKYAPKRKLVRRRRLARPIRRRYVRKGGFSLNRKLSLITTYAHASVAGVMTKNDPTGTCLDIGTPTLITGSSNCYDIPFSLKFRLDQLMNSTDITGIADQYKINSVKVKVHCNAVNTSYNLSSAGGQPWIEYIQDHDDAALPTLAFMREKMGVRTKYFTGSRAAITMGVRPRIADIVYFNSTALVNAYAVNKKSQWINSTYPNVEHYGIKGVLHNVQLPGSANVTNVFEWDVTQYVVAADLQ